MLKRMIILAYCIIMIILIGCDGEYKINNDHTDLSSVIISEANGTTEQKRNNDNVIINEVERSSDFIQDILPYNGESYIIINNNIPTFSTEEKTCTEAFEIYSNLDSRGRCGVAFANVCKEMMPTEKRGNIGDIRPSGWHTVKYPDVIKDNYLYNRSHLIAYSLTGENDNEKNLITGTRYLNQDTMQIFEMQVLDYLRNYDNHVLYRVTPVFEGNNLLATGVLMEAWSVEDQGKGICFNVFCYNVQPYIEIDYATGESRESASVDDNSYNSINTGNVVGFENMKMIFILNTNTKKIHMTECENVKDINDRNKSEYEGTLKELKEHGYTPCGNCLLTYR